MKNLLDNKEFLKIKENNQFSSYDKLYESLDMSNKIGWSDSLVGRAVNKLFSFGKSIKDAMVLKSLKRKLENEYFKGVLKAMTKENMEMDEKTADFTVAVWLIKKSESDLSAEEQESKITAILSETLDNTFVVELPKEINLDEYIYQIMPKDENAEVITDGVESKTKLKTNVNVKTEPFNFKIKIGDSEKTYTILTMLIGDEDTDDLLAIGEGEDDLPAVATTTQISKVQNECEVGSVCTFTNKEGEKKEIKILSLTDHIDAGEDDKFLTVDDKKVQSLAKGMVYVQFKDSEGNFSNSSNRMAVNIKQLSCYKQGQVDSKKYSLPEPATKGKITIEECKNLITALHNVYENIQKDTNISDEHKTRIKKAYHSFDITIHPDTMKNYSDEERYKQYELFKQVLSNVSESKKELELLSKINEIMDKINNLDIITESNYNSFLRRNYHSELNSLVSEGVGQKTKTVMKSVVKKLTPDEQKKLGLNKSQTLKQLLSGDRLYKADKDIMSAYGDIDASKIDPAAVAKKFIDNIKLRELATTLVNKEALKEIALRAQWMYDTEKYEDKRNQHYTRVNFTTTHGDMAKLKNNWLKKIAKAKAEYTPFFADKNGNFPQGLDPIALINSDETFRKNWNQYSEEDLKKKSNLGAGGGIPRSNLSNEEMDKLYLDKDKKMQVGNIGVLESKTNDSDEAKPFGLIAYLHQVEGIYVYEIFACYDTDKIAGETKELKRDDKEKIKEIISKYTYSRINPNLDNATNEMKKIFMTFVYTKRDDAKDYTKNIHCGLVYDSSVDKSQKRRNMLYYVYAKKETGEESDFISVHEEGDPDNNHIIEIEKLEDISFSEEWEMKHPRFYYNFYIDRSSIILDSGVWDTDKFKSNVDAFKEVKTRRKDVDNAIQTRKEHKEKVQ